MTFPSCFRSFAAAAALLLLSGTTSCTPAGPQPPARTEDPRAHVPPVPASVPEIIRPEVVAAAPAAKREFRGLWIASVGNMDWPSRSGLTSAQQQAELRGILDSAVQLRLNAIILQVRPAADALYPSALEPWSEFLTGKSGVAPEPFYDPLEFAIREAHARGLELHAWFNPYRARYSSRRGVAAASHITRARPELVGAYGNFEWMDPGEPAVRAHTLAVITDVVRRYDVDGITIDDYFYPYREYDKRGKLIPFPDDASWGRYQANGGALSRADWRRENVNGLVQDLYRVIKKEKAWVKFGISPFGIRRPGFPESVYGLDSYVELFADSRKWLAQGWLDYFSPQLYWPVDAERQSYRGLLRWWSDQNTYSRHLWPANHTGRVTERGARAWSADEIFRQVRLTRDEPGATGNIHFGLRPLMRDIDGLGNGFRSDLYREPALVPASPWLGAAPPQAPSLRVGRASAGAHVLTIDPAPGVAAWLYVVRTYDGSLWQVQVVPAGRTPLQLPAGTNAVHVSSVSRTGVEGPASSVAAKALLDPPAG